MHESQNSHKSQIFQESSVIHPWVSTLLVGVFTKKVTNKYNGFLHSDTTKCSGDKTSKFLVFPLFHAKSTGQERKKNVYVYVITPIYGNFFVKAFTKIF